MGDKNKKKEQLFLKTIRRVKVTSTGVGMLRSGLYPWVLEQCRAQEALSVCQENELLKDCYSSG